MSNPVTPAQASILQFFSRPLPANSFLAHQQITEILGNPVDKQRWICERARRCVATLEPTVCGTQSCHDKTFGVACCLVHGFDLSTAEAEPIFREWMARGTHVWSETEIAHKLSSAGRTTHDKPRGHLLGDGFSSAPSRSNGSGQASGRHVSTPSSTAAAKPARVYTPRKLACAFDPEKLKKLASKWSGVVNVEWLANRSVVDPAEVGPKRFLELIYPRGEKVLLFTIYESQGQAFWPDDEVPVCGENGVWYLAQPVNGEYRPNPRVQDKKTGEAKMSRRSMESVTAFRYLVLESDKADIRDWMGLLVQLPLQIEAIYTSGGKSVHALVRVDCRTHREWEDYVIGLMPTLNLLGLAGVDPKTLTSVRLTRLPGCLRAGTLQKLLYLRPGAEVRPIAEVPAGHDVTAKWLAKYNRVIDGYDEPTRELRRALWYYGPACQACRTAAKEIGAMEEAKELTRS